MSSNKPKYVNVVKDDYKPPLASVFAFAKSKKKKCSIRNNYVLRSVKERREKLAMALDLPFGQQGTTTPAPPKTRSMSSIGDTIVAPNFEENLSRPHDYERDKPVLTRLKKAGCKTVEPGANWVMVSPHFLPCILGGTMPDYFSNGVRYLVPWRDVKKETMVENNEKKIDTTSTLYLNEHGVLQSNGISVENYEITYLFPKEEGSGGLCFATPVMNQVGQITNSGADCAGGGGGRDVKGLWECRQGREERGSRRSEDAGGGVGEEVRVGEAEGGGREACRGWGGGGSGAWGGGFVRAAWATRVRGARSLDVPPPRSGGGRGGGVGREGVGMGGSAARYTVRMGVCSMVPLRPCLSELHGTGRGGGG
ncbi:hypothetical protein Tco_0513868 [Tanacetum coccineum]